MGTGPVSGVILAAGMSRRIGEAGPKQLIGYRGRPLLSHAIDTARASSLSETVVVVGHEADLIRTRLGLGSEGVLRAVVNQDFTSGVASSLKAGLMAVDARAEAVCVLLGDQPGLEAGLIDRVIAAGHSSDRPALRPLYAGGVPGHPVWLERRLWPRVSELKGDEGLRSLFAGSPELLEELPVEGRAPRDIDRTDDLEDPA